MTSKNLPVPEAHATATLKELLCLPANAGALRFRSLGLVSEETPFIRDTQPHTLRQCSCTSRHVSGIVTYFITRYYLRAQLSTWTQRLASVIDGHKSHCHSEQQSIGPQVFLPRILNCLCLYPLPKAHYETTSSPDRDRDMKI